jgi:predicted outer membrane repeat protein
MRLYEEVTGKSAAFAKNSSAKGGAIQHSTDFVFRCLKKIHSRATLSQAITCINSVRRAEKEESRLNNLIDDAFNRAMAARQLKP